jgi:hypothetical protein
VSNGGNDRLYADEGGALQVGGSGDDRLVAADGGAIQV